MSNCVFCNRANLALLTENQSAFAIRDSFPVRPLHTLILPKRHVADTFALAPAELQDLFDLARKVRDTLLVEDPAVKGYNFGTNNGVDAGQKIFHVHFHLIPRRDGETPPPPAYQEASGMPQEPS